MNANSRTAVAALILTFAAAATAADFPQWRGPKRDGISPEKGLLKQWPEGGPKLLWQAKGAGGGYSTPAVAGERLYLMGNRGMDEEFVQARSVADGKEAWTVRVGKVGNPDQRPAYPGARGVRTLWGPLALARLERTAWTNRSSPNPISASG